MQHQSDIKLAEDFKKGDRRAFEVVFDRFYRQLLIFAISLVHDDQEAEDIVAGAMSKLWKIHQNFDNLANIRAFLYITVRNQCFNYLRSEKVRNKYTTEATYLKQGESEKFVLAQMVEMELFEMIRREIDTLSPQRKAVLTLSFFENMSNREIAEKMQLSVNTIEATKTRAIQQLKTIIFKKKLFAVLVMVLAFILS